MESGHLGICCVISWDCRKPCCRISIPVLHSCQRESCWFLFLSKGVSTWAVFPHPLFIQTLRVFKGYLFFCFEHFTGTLLFTQAKAWSTTEYLSCCTDWIQVCFLSVITPLWCIKNVMGDTRTFWIPWIFLGHCVMAELWMQETWQQERSSCLGCLEVLFTFFPDGFGTGKIAMKFQRVAVIRLSISLPCSTVHS